MASTETPAQVATLFERIGGADKLRAIVTDIVHAHLANASIRTRFEPFDREALSAISYAFFAQATGGPQEYTGRGLRETHRGMNVNEHEFVAATDDVMAVLQRHGVGQAEQLEVLGAFFAMKGDVLHL